MVDNYSRRVIQVKPTEVTISNRTVVRVIVLIVLTILGLRVLNNISHVLSLIFIAFFLGLALNPFVSWFVRKLHLKSRVTATAIAYLSVLAVLGTMIAIVFPPLIRQTVDFISDAPQTVRSLNDENTSLGSLVKRYNLQDEVEGLSDNIKQRTQNLRDPVVTTAGRVGSTLISIITVIVLTFMMLVEGPNWNARFWTLMPKHNRDRWRVISERMYRAVTGYVNGQVVIALLAASFAMVMLLITSTLLNVSINAVGLAGILVFTGLIPMIGNTIGGVIVTLACALVSLPLALIMALYFVIYQQIENVTLQPYIQARYNELTPLLVFVAALLGVGFGGLIGAFIAIPAAACSKILFLDFMDNRANRTKEA
jgi:predicted PurR-regulated permease PerM